MRNGALAGGCRLVLGSASPRRHDLLAAAGFTFDVRPVEVAEARLEDEDAEEYARRLARWKAEAVPRGGDEVILAADTIVVVDDQILGKPRDADDAARMLRLLAGRDHEVITAICLQRGPRSVVDAARTRVWFAPMSAAEIAEYVASGEPSDKAGAYAIQGLASKHIEKVEGCYFNVVGLPVSLVYRHLRDLCGHE